MFLNKNKKAELIHTGSGENPGETQDDRMNIMSQKTQFRASIEHEDTQEPVATRRLNNLMKSTETRISASVILKMSARHSKTSDNLVIQDDDFSRAPKNRKTSVSNESRSK